MPAYRRKATWVTSSGARNQTSSARPITLAANTAMITEAPTEAPSGHCTFTSSQSATENLARRSSARMRAPITASTSQPISTRNAITATMAPQSCAMTWRYSSGRKANATAATASSRVAIPVRPAGRPAATCGSAPIVIPAAVTATTCRAGIRAMCGWPATEMSSA
jgi:hypothetical protein